MLSLPTCPARGWYRLGAPAYSLLPSHQSKPSWAVNGLPVPDAPWCGPGPGPLPRVPSNQGESGAAPQEDCTSRRTRRPALPFWAVSGKSVQHPRPGITPSSHHPGFSHYGGPHLWRRQSWATQICVKVKATMLGIWKAAGKGEDQM